MTDNISLEDAKAMFKGAMLIATGIPEDATFPPEMAQLLLQRRCKDSSISFKAIQTRTSFAGDAVTNLIRRVSVHMGTDYIGSVDVTKERYETVYTVKSPKAENDRPRKGKVETKSYKTAITLLDRYLLPIGNVQRYERERAELDFKHRQWSSEFSELKRSKDKQLGDIVSAASQVMEVCSLLKVAPLVVEKLEETITRIELLGSLVSGSVGYNYVHIHNGLCEVLYQNGSPYVPPRVYPATTLPPELARKIGMLKVASPEVLIKGVGVKKSDNTFLVIGAFDAR
jgi:hypothetical protein